MRKFKKILSILLITAIIFPMLPIGEIKALAVGPITITKVDIFKEFDTNQKIISRGITIKGTNLNDEIVKLYTDKAPITLGKINGNISMYFEIDNKYNDLAIMGIEIGDAYVEFNESSMPNISTNGISPKRLKNESTLSIKGTNLDQVNSDGITAKISSSTNIIENITLNHSQNGTVATIEDINGENKQDIIFEKKGDANYKVNGVAQSEKVEMDVRYVYSNQFTIYRDIELDNIEIIPNRTEAGSIIKFISPHVPGSSKNLKRQDVFFLEQTGNTQLYNNTTKGETISFGQESRGTGENKKLYNVLTVKVPKGLTRGSYFISFTNQITGTTNLWESIYEEIILGENKKLTIIQGGTKPSITTVDPAYGSSNGEDVTIIGEYIGSLNIGEFTQNTPGIKSVNAPINENKLIIEYGQGSYGTGEDKVEIVSATREIVVFIGKEASYQLDETGKPLVEFNVGRDIIKVKTSPLADNDTQPMKDVHITIKTTLLKDDNTSIVFEDSATRLRGFEYIPSKVQPKVDAIIPPLIEVDKIGTNNYSVPQGRQIAIHGENLMIHRYIEDGVEVVRYPRIQIGSIDIDKNKNSLYDVKVINEDGVVLDGARGREFGTKILITMPLGQTIKNIGQAIVTVTNPMRNSKIEGLPDSSKTVEFVEVIDEDKPEITEVMLNTSSVEGGEKVTITGSKFQEGLKVYIDGEEVKNPIVKLGGREIEIITPKGRETKTQIQVMNPKGGMDWKPFTYLITRSQPKITSFNPPKGEKGTPVVIKGTGFLLPDPNSSKEIPEKAVGTRVLLGDPKVKASDINEYNRDKHGEITFEAFNPGLQLFGIEENKLKVSDFYSGIVLVDQNNKRYIIEKHPDGRVFITDRSLEKYKIEIKDGKIQASKEGGSISSIADNGKGIILGDGNLILSYETAYKFNGSEIIGQRARVIDENTIYFYVPEKPLPGYYDLTVMNPDTKKDTKEGKNGFEYLNPSGPVPTISNINPNKGDVSGGYPIRIKGTNFSIDPEHPSKVYIDGQSATITGMSIDGTYLVVTVPKYTGDLRKKETSQLPVLVVVQNPGGRTVGTENMFSYIIPNTKPVINKIIPAQGSTAGDMLEIHGIEFLMQETGEDLNSKGGKNDNLIDPDLTKDDRDFLADKKTDIKAPYGHYYDSPILPKVYFGNDEIGYKEGKILDFAGGNFLRVLAPDNQGGKMDVYITNHDGGTSNRLAYTYNASKVSIKSINPSQSRKQGGIKADLRGTGFQNSNIEIYKQDGSKEKKITPLVRFGDITNKDLPIDHENSGWTKGPITRVKLDGDLEVEYRIGDKQVNLQIKEKVEDEYEYYKLSLPYNSETVYVPVNLLKVGSKNYKGRELIKISMEGTRFIVERGYTPIAKLVNDTHIELETPSYFEAKKNVPIYIINPDKGNAKYTNFNYTNPESEPVITNITRGEIGPKPVDGGNDKVALELNYKGGMEIIVTGRDFRKGAKITIEDFMEIDADFISEEELRFIMPELKDMTKIDFLHKLRVENEDGGTAVSTDANPEIYIKFTKGETTPVIDNIVPNSGPATGGTRVTINGNDFRTQVEGFTGEIKVFFGEVQAKNVIIKDYKTIEVIAPESDVLGPVKVTIENPDDERTQSNLVFTYISKPRIDDMNPKKIFTNDTKTVVTLTGKQFLPGAKVIVGGKIIPTKDLKGEILNGSGIRGVDSLGNNTESSVVNGKQTATAVVEGDGTIKITFAEGADIENTSIIVINPDGGISEPYNDFKYEKPVPLKPMVLEAIPGFESTVMLIWNESDPDLLNRASNYEIYGRKTKDKANTFIGSTEGADFLIKGLEANTEYEFLVRALNEHGAAIDFATVIVKTLSVQEDYKQKEKEDKLKEKQKDQNLKGSETITGKKVTKTLGSEDIKNGLGLIDFTLSKYKDMNEFVIRIPLALARKDSTLTIRDSTLNMVINPKDLYTYKVSTMDEGDKDANLEIRIKRANETNIPRGKKLASQAYELDFMFQRTKERINIDKLLRSGKIGLKLDSLMYKNAKNPYLAKLNIQKGVYEKVGTAMITSFDTKGKYLLMYDR